MKSRSKLIALGMLCGIACSVGGCHESQSITTLAAREEQPGPTNTLKVNFDPPNSVDFDVLQTNPGKAIATWKITPDPDAPTTPNVLTLTHTENTGSTFNLAVFKSPSLGDLELSVRIRANTGQEDQGGGLIWRCRDENNYYVCRLNPLEHNFRVYKVEGGKRTQFASADTDAAAGKWHTIRITMIGSRIECYLNGEKLLTATDETFREPGRIGLWTKADAASSFDNLSAHGLVPPE